MSVGVDVIIIGAGIVGLSTGLKIVEKTPHLKVIIIEKEEVVCKHQTGNNSGVIHSGIYYKPGSLKAENCIKGYAYLLDFCAKHDVKHEVCGKVIVATKESERHSLDNIYKRGVENGLSGLKKISADEVTEHEPHVRSIGGIWVPQTGIVDYVGMGQKMMDSLIEMGGEVHLGHKVIDIREGSDEIVVKTDKGDFQAKQIINCAGLYCDKIANMTSIANKEVQIIPFRGEYYELKKEKEYLVKNLIYPVPNPDFPFLGVHFTRMVKGGIEAGPNAVLAFKREGYKKSDVNIKELWETLSFPGFRKIATKYWDEGIMEMKRSFSKKLFVKALQELIPEIQMEDVVPSGAGVRAQACHSDGALLDDFSITASKNMIHVYNAPSPAATSSLAIGEHISELIKKNYK